MQERYGGLFTFGKNGGNHESEDNKKYPETYGAEDRHTSRITVVSRMSQAHNDGTSACSQSMHLSLHFL